MSTSKTCGSCHTSYPTGPNYANGYKGKANSHPKHAVFWGFTCDWCHNQTVVYRNNSTVISNYRNHVNKNYNVVANGTKTFITQGSVGDTFVVLALTSPARRQHGITAFVVEKGAPGFTQRPIKDKLGMRASDTAELHLDCVEVGDDHRLGEVDHGFLDTLQILDRGRITIGALAVGLHRLGYEIRTELGFGRLLLSIDDVTEKFNVTSKTIQRWRRRG